ncbi:hypothetical protein D3C77_651400 [compost metagenome]
MNAAELVYPGRLICRENMLDKLTRIVAEHIFLLITVLLRVIVQPELDRRVILQYSVQLLEQLFLGQHGLVAVLYSNISPQQQLFFECAREHR